MSVQMPEDMKLIDQGYFDGERPLYHARNLKITNTRFGEGESPLKEGKNLDLNNVIFGWKYPLWYDSNVMVRNSVWETMGRAGVWYVDHMEVHDCMIEAPKNFRRCTDLLLENVTFSEAKETLWACRDVALDHVVVTQGDYFGMNCENLNVNCLQLYGNYTFDGVKNMTIDHSKLLCRDALWNTENVTVKNSFLSGEYLGWNSRNLTFINCVIESEQGLCYIDHLTLDDCKLLQTNLSFEFVNDVDARINSVIDSVKNPISGKILADGIKELILDPELIDPGKTEIVVKE